MKVTLSICKMTFPLFSFIPAFLPSSTPGHESENLTPRRREERKGRGTVEGEGRQIEGRTGRRGGEDSSRRVDRYLAETWEDASWALLPRWTLNESKRRWRGSPGSHVLYSILYSTAPNRSVYSITARALGYYLLHNSIMRVEAETTYYISSSTNPAQTQK